MQTAQPVALDELADTKHSQVVCYPRCEQHELKNRLNELKSLGVEALEFTGQRTVFGIPVLGKGYVGVVVVAHTSTGKAALKIRRIDSEREAMFPVTWPGILSLKPMHRERDGTGDNLQLHRCF